MKKITLEKIKENVLENEEMTKAENKYREILDIHEELALRIEDAIEKAIELTVFELNKYWLTKREKSDK